MAVDTKTRNLRDGTYIIQDGASAALTLTLDEGDLKWTEVGTETIEVKDRGVLSHTRPGDQMSCSLSFTVKWVQLIGDTISGSSDGTLFYEFVTNRHNTYVSTLSAGEQFALRHIWEVAAPGGGGGSTNERITFEKVYRESVEMSEGNEYNTIAFSGRDFEVRPTIVRF